MRVPWSHPSQSDLCFRRRTTCSWVQKVSAVNPVCMRVPCGHWIAIMKIYYHIMAKKIETATQAKHRCVHAREITRLRHVRLIFFFGQGSIWILTGQWVQRENTAWRSAAPLSGEVHRRKFDQCPGWCSETSCKDTGSHLPLTKQRGAVEAMQERSGVETWCLASIFWRPWHKTCVDHTEVLRDSNDLFDITLMSSTKHPRVSYSVSYRSSACWFFYKHVVHQTHGEAYPLDRQSVRVSPLEYSLVQWNWFSHVTECTWSSYIQVTSENQFHCTRLYSTIHRCQVLVRSQ